MSYTNVFLLACFLLFLCVINLYFLHVISLDGETSSSLVGDGTVLDIDVDIVEYLRYLPSVYKTRNPKYPSIQRKVLKSFNVSYLRNIQETWLAVSTWQANNSLFPDQVNTAGEVVTALRTAKILSADNAMKGTQLKLLLHLEGNQKAFFKPKRYDMDEIILGHIYAGFDRHNSEVFAYYLATVLDMKWIAPSAIRHLDVRKEILSKASSGLRKTITKGHANICIYGQCFYCKPNETVCADNNGLLEGSVILLVDKQLKIFKSPWRRSYSTRKMEWEKDNEYCEKVKLQLSQSRVLDLVDTAIFDFLIQNGDRHRYEVFNDKIVLLDNGKGLGNPNIDVLDILAPLYQCCMIRTTTWHQLELLSGGVLSETIRALSLLQGEQLASDGHYIAIERRLLKVYANVHMCIGKLGGAKVFN